MSAPATSRVALAGAARTFEVVVCVPGDEVRFPAATSLRLCVADGLRGVLPGHEPALVRVTEGELQVTHVDAGGVARSRIATEGGLAHITPTSVLLVLRWATIAAQREELMRRVLERAAERATLEREAVRLSHQHERATRRALARLQREVAR
ncbi:MAG: hypothetical protein KC636_13845 [Myxococcales bacterium]|nr:hypothetical protein [Myxococcales bacterium]